MQPLIAPSILAADFARLGNEVRDVMDAGADLIHFDVMDNHYVPNLSVGPLVLRSLVKRHPDVEFDVHLMVSPVERLVDEFAAAGAAWITIHPEATEHPHAVLSQIRRHGCKSGVSLNPGTPLGVVEPLLNSLDLILIMSVNPGFGGQSFLPEVLPKTRCARALIDQSGHSIRLEIDGGIAADTIGDAHRAGADMFVAGSAVFGADNYSDAIQSMRVELNA